METFSRSNQPTASLSNVKPFARARLLRTGATQAARFFFPQIPAGKDADGRGAWLRSGSSLRAAAEPRWGRRRGGQPPPAGPGEPPALTMGQTKAPASSKGPNAAGVWHRPRSRSRSGAAAALGRSRSQRPRSPAQAGPVPLPITPLRALQPRYLQPLRRGSSAARHSPPPRVAH